MSMQARLYQLATAKIYEKKLGHTWWCETQFFIFVYFRIKMWARMWGETKNREYLLTRSKVEAGRKRKHKHYWCNKESDNLCLMRTACKIEVALYLRCAKTVRDQEEDENFFFLSFHSLGASCTFTLRKVVNFISEKSERTFNSCSMRCRGDFGGGRARDFDGTVNVWCACSRSCLGS